MTEPITAPLPGGLTWVRVLDVPDAGAPKGLEEVAFGFRQVRGRWVCSGVALTVEGELTSDTWRRLRPAAMIEEAGAAARLFTRNTPTVPSTRPRVGVTATDTLFYGEIAKLYRQAITEQRSRPVAWMADELGEDDPERVRRWVMKARKLGYLRPGIAGKPGELPAKGKRP